MMNNCPSGAKAIPSAIDVPVVNGTTVGLVDPGFSMRITELLQFPSVTKRSPLYGSKARPVAHGTPEVTVRRKVSAGVGVELGNRALETGCRRTAGGPG